MHFTSDAFKDEKVFLRTKSFFFGLNETFVAFSVLTETGKIFSKDVPVFKTQS